MTWRNVRLAVSRKFRIAAKDKYGIEGDLLKGLIMRLAPGDIVPECIGNSCCAICSCKQDRGNSRLVLGWSLDNPLQFFSYCNNCDREWQAERRKLPAHKFVVWINSNNRIEHFETRDSALHTVMTVAAQGFCAGPAGYNARDALYLCNMAEKAYPASFWSERSSLSLPLETFFMNRNIDHRIRYLNKLDEEWEDSVKWADNVIEELRGGFDFQKEKKKAWTSEWEKQWKTFVANKDFHGKEGRICWSKYEWRFFKEKCQGRSLVE
ncbi:hypothetical protein BGZ97_009290 [Linnemannia gamsii]|uniref:Uncharacterized protein n=1 Tax=Linnemannia gamsii TaxID=64522 RepID=A0A9P6QLH6_9FUNG|nr:hypothetical protein BGZ97_009290 [Linnemannia gamsii]